METIGHNGYTLTVLGNGVRIISEPVASTYSVSLGIWVDAGSRDEPDELAGVSHFIEHMVFKGTATRSALDIAKQIDRIGGMANAFTSKERTCFHAKVLKEHLPVMVDLLADLYLGSTFDPEDIDREKQVVVQEIRMVEDTPDEYIHVVFGRHFFDGNPLARPVLGNVETVMGLKRDHITGHLGQKYAPHKTVIAAAGAVEHDRLVELCAPHFAALPENRGAENRIGHVTSPSVKVYPRDLEQTHICLGTLGPSAVDDDRYASTLLNVILGGNMSSRLFQDVREKYGLAYSIYSFLSSYVDTGVLGVYVAVDPDTAHQTLELIMANIKKLVQNDIKPAEMDAAKEHIKGSILLAAENTDNRMTRLARNLIHFDRCVTYEEIIGRIMAVDSADVRRVARRLIRPEYMNLVVLGPQDEKDFDPSLLAL